MPRGYAVKDPKNWRKMEVIDFELKTKEDDDVTIAITHCGVCGSDLHTCSGGWGELSVEGGVIVGHEIVGKVIEVGKNVTEFKEGQRVGVGAQVGSCGNCAPCKSDNENYCVGDGKGYLVDTYNATYPDGSVAQGGYSDTIRAHQQFVFAIPEGLAAEDAAPMLCGGLTSYSPLVRNGCGPGKRVAVVGLGGLGHFGVLFGAALGAEIVVISHSPAKREDALKMGASEFISTKEQPEWYKDVARSKPFDFILSTASSSAIDLPSILSTLKPQGKLIMVGMPEDAFNDVRVQAFSGNGCFFGSSHIGSKVEANAMLKLAAEKGIKAWTEVLDMKDAPLALERVHKNDIRYRFVLRQDLTKVE